MNEQRPDPDELLARVQTEEAHQARGKLKIFFGASAGVGKTYAMIEAALSRRVDGVDVVVGYVETHGRVEIERLLGTPTLRGMLSVLPRRTVEYRGTTLQEFDLDAALTRMPQLILVDELAHTNAPGSRHPKRWQDVLELLAAGIDVYTTVNVQHIESLNDVVAQITGVLVGETVLDAILDQADEVELIDLPPDDLLQRLKEGKVYIPQHAEAAARNFFRKGNLIALRELALRRTADRVDAQMQRYRRDHAIAQTWPTHERILVGISHQPLSARLVRAARRMATGLHAEWIVAYVETSKHPQLAEVDRERVIQTLRLAEQLGAETVTLSGEHVSEELLTYARARNVSKIVVGKPLRPRWREILFGSVVDELVRRSGEIDVYVISGEQDDTRPPAVRPFEQTNTWSGYGWTLLVVTLCTALAAVIRLMLPSFAEANLIMAYLLGVIVVATRFKRGPAILASVLSVAAFDVFFVPPYLTFAVADVQYLATFAVMLLVALIVSTLTVRLRQQASAARQREQHTAAIYALSKELASLRGLENLMGSAVCQISETFDSRVVILLPNAAGHLQVWGGIAGLWEHGVDDRSVFAPDANDQGVAQWVYGHGQMAGMGTDTLAGASAFYLPLVASRGTAGVLGVRPAQPRRFLAPEQLHLLEAFANQTALAIERAGLADEAHRATVQIETERLRSALLSSVSHDLRTPLAVITGAISSLLEGRDTLDAATRDELAGTAYAEAERLNRLLRNLLDMTKLEAGAVEVHKEWQPLEEVIGAALTRLEAQLQGRPITIDLPPDLPLVPLDSVLIEQMLVNLLENALKYTPPASPIDIAAWAASDAVIVEMADRGPGLPDGNEQRIFDKFYRVARADTPGGVGLGLTICRAIIEAHGGRIWAENRPGSGVIFRFTLPLEGTPPDVGVEAEDIAVRSSEPA